MKWLLYLTFILLCISCTVTKYVDRPVPVETVRTEYVNKIFRDSVVVHDSIDRYVSGDTVWLYKYKYIYVYRDRADTVAVNDTIEIPVEVKTTEVKEVNKLKWYQTTLMWIGGIALLILSFKVGKRMALKI